LVWIAGNGKINVRWGYGDGVWQFDKEVPDNGLATMTDLSNDYNYWFQIQRVGSCGTSNWSISIDPLP
jgi:hypothetical protein